MDFQVDLSFLNYRDEEDTARDAGIRWKYFSKKFHSPVVDNMLEWATVTEFVPKKYLKPPFEVLPEFKQQLSNEKIADEKHIEKYFGLIYQGKREQAALIRKSREERRKEIQLLHDRAWQQKVKRDLAIQRIKEKYYWPKNKVDKAEYANFFAVAARSKGTVSDASMLVEPHLVSRKKTFQEMFQDLMDWHYAENGDEKGARADAETYLALRDWSFDPRKVDLTAPATARGIFDPEFEQKAHQLVMQESVLLPKREETQQEVEARWSEEIEANFVSEKDKFLAKEKLEECKPARVEKEGQDEQSFNVFQIMEAWTRKYCHSVGWQEQEALEVTRSLGQRLFGAERPAQELESDQMLAQAEVWSQEELERRRAEFRQKVKHLEDKYRVFCWLLTVDLVKEFICREDLLLQPRYDVGETVTQVAILTYVYLNPELSKQSVEEYADEFLNSWVRLQESTDLSKIEEELMQKFEQQGLALIRNSYTLLGTWARVRLVTRTFLRTAADPKARFTLHTRL